MSRLIPPKPVLIEIEETVYSGTLRTCEWTPDGSTCSGVVSWAPQPGEIRTDRLPMEAIRDPDDAGHPCCPEDSAGC